MFKHLGSKALIVVLVAGASSVAMADVWPQSVWPQGVWSQTIWPQGIMLHGAQTQTQIDGRKTDEAQASKARVTSITLADGTVLRAR
jgi:hypothetical protein